MDVRCTIQEACPLSPSVCCVAKALGAGSHPEVLGNADTTLKGNSNLVSKASHTPWFSASQPVPGEESIRDSFVVLIHTVRGLALL